ncbi:MAG: MFS transporter [Negativicutes bacterium]|nr:MFS transporter [Negativicutes bacterium]
MTLLRALNHRNYRLYFLGQGISQMGTWMQIMAMSWLVYRLTASPFMLGAISFSSQVPSLLFGPLAGVVSDRFSRHRIIIFTQVLSMLQAAVLAGLVLTGSIAIWQLFILSLLLGCVNAFDMPVRQSFVIDLLEHRRDLPNAIALNSMMINIARLVGPSAAGILISLVGEGMCFLLNAVSFLAVIAALLAMRVHPARSAPSGGSTLEALREGYEYAFRLPPIKYMIFLMATVSMVGLSFPVLMPIFAGDIYAGGPHTLGYLMGAIGVGAFVGGFYLASRKSAAGLEKAIPVAVALFGTALVLFSQVRHLGAALAILFLAGLGMILFISSTNTLLQTVVDDDKRGRVMSLYTMSFMGMAPFGSLIAGSLASHIGTPETVLFGGLVSIAGGALFAWRLPRMKPYFAQAFKRHEAASRENPPEAKP